jgi:hypothetical protein
VLIDQTFSVHTPLEAMSPIAVEPDFTRRYIENQNNEFLVRRIQNSFDRLPGKRTSLSSKGPATRASARSSIFPMLASPACWRVAWCWW